MMILKDRREAGALLAGKLISYKDLDAVVYALPRGGVAVGAEIAKRLKIPLNVAITKKIGHPFNPEYAVCALSESGDLVCGEEEKEMLGESWLKEAVEKAQDEIKRRRSQYLVNKMPAIGRTVILVDDGMATGLTMKAAIKWAERERAKKIIVAVPVAPKEIAEELREEIDEFIALDIPEYYLGSVGAYYMNFEQVADEEVKNLLAQKYDKV